MYTDPKMGSAAGWTLYQNPPDDDGNSVTS